jgi:hypothetical protein
VSRELRGRLGTPLAVGVTVWAVYLLLIVSVLGSGHDPRDFVDEGRFFLLKAHSSPVIKIDPAYRGYDFIGYDGQFFYYIALDPIGARPYVDTPAYRYARIVYPILARILAFGRPGLVPYSLIFVNWMAAGLGTMAVAVWLRRRRVSPWYAIVFGLFPGILIALRYDLSEVLAYALAAIAVLLFDSPRRQDRLLAGLVFGVAVLTREAVAVFAVFFLVMELMRDREDLLAPTLRRNWLPAAAFGALSLGPFVLWKGVLYLWLGGLGAGLNELFEPVPFLGIARVLVHPAGRLGPDESLRSVVVPSTIVLGLILLSWWRRPRYALGWLYVLNYVPFVVFLSHNSYIDEIASPRVITGVVLAGVLCVPQLLLLGPTIRATLWAAVALWLSALPNEVLPPVLQLLAQAVKHRPHLHL